MLVGMKILFFGDIVGALGRSAVAKILPDLTAQYAPDFIIANVENLAHGAGVTEQTLNELTSAGVDAFTGGNHSWANPLGTPVYEKPEWKSRMVVPTNYGAAKNGQNVVVIEKNEVKLRIINVHGQLFSHSDTRSPFGEIDRILLATPNATLTTIVDFHAEATAEKEAFGHYTDGRVSAVLGTHTHVPTADQKILPGGTAYVTDVGRCGAEDSVVGFEKKTAIKRFLTGKSSSYDLDRTGRAEVNAILLEINTSTRHATRIDRIREFVDV